jgi:hypothetical protein
MDENVGVGVGPGGARPTRWRRRGHTRAPAAHVGTPQAGRGAEAKVGDLPMANKLLEAKIERLETARPLGQRRSRR